MVKHDFVKERFPVTLGLLAIDLFAVMTLPFLALSVNVTPDLSAKSVILLVMFLVGAVLLFATSVVFTGGLDLIKPDKPFEPFTLGQAVLVIIGFGIVGVWQLYINQAFITPAVTTRAAIIVDPTTAVIFSVDTAIAEEMLLGAFTILVFVTLVYFKAGTVISGLTALLGAAAFFTWLHFYVYGTNPAALVFVFGARLALSGVLIGSIYLSRGRAHLTAALAAPPLIHIGWNLGTVLG